MIPKWLSLKLKMTFLRFHWLLIILLLVVFIVDYILYNYLISVGEKKIDIFGVLVPVTSIAIASIGISYQVNAAKNREILFKVHQQRKDTYECVLKMLDEISKIANKEKEDYSSEGLENAYREARPKMIMYASPEVINVYKAIENTGRPKGNRLYRVKTNIINLLIKIRTKLNFIKVYVPKEISEQQQKAEKSYQNTVYIAELLVKIRTESGFSEDDVPTRKLLSFIINDINDKNFDYMFDKQGYIKKDLTYPFD